VKGHGIVKRGDRSRKNRKGRTQGEWERLGSNGRGWKGEQMGGARGKTVAFVDRCPVTADESRGSIRGKREVRRVKLVLLCGCRSDPSPDSAESFGQQHVRRHVHIIYSQGRRTELAFL
jgi:hypothetical protein